MLFSGAVTAYNGGTTRQILTSSITTGLVAATAAYIVATGVPLAEAGLTKVGVTAVQVAASGAVGAGYSALWGGDVASGALTGAAAALFSAGVGAIDIAGPAGSVARIVAAAVASGAVAELGGGKFVNGAISGAFFRLVAEANTLGGQAPADTEEARSPAHNVQLADMGVTSTPCGPSDSRECGLFGAPEIVDLDEAMEQMPFAVGVTLAPLGGVAAVKAAPAVSGAAAEAAGLIAAGSRVVGSGSRRVFDFIVRGKEITIGKTVRIAPFGNRTGHPTGKFPS